MQVDAPPLAHQATTPMLVSPSSSSAASAAAAADAAKGERLRALLFGAEHAERAGDLAGAQVSEKERERGKGVFFDNSLFRLSLRSLTFEKKTRKPPPLSSRSGSSC